MDVSGAGKNNYDASDIQILETPPPCSRVNLIGANATTLDETVTSEPKGKRSKTLTSDVWNYFEKIGIGKDGKEKCRCKGCGSELGCVPKNGTSHVSRHQYSCKFIATKFPNVGNMLLDAEGRLKRRTFDPKASCEILAETIVTHGAPFNIVEWRVFRKYQKFLNEDCKWITRNTIKADIFETYKVEKEKLKAQLALIPRGVCLTSDCWTSCTNLGFITLTAHYVDVDCKLNNKILAFAHIKPPHSGSQLALIVMEILRDWAIERKIFSLTLDNASANDNMQNYLKEHLGLANSLLLKR